MSDLLSGSPKYRDDPKHLEILLSRNLTRQSLCKLQSPTRLGVENKYGVNEPRQGVLMRFWYKSAALAMYRDAYGKNRSHSAEFDQCKFEGLFLRTNLRQPLPYFHEQLHSQRASTSFHNSQVDGH